MKVVVDLTCEISPFIQVRYGGGSVGAGLLGIYFPDTDRMAQQILANFVGCPNRKAGAVVPWRAL